MRDDMAKQKKRPPELQAWVDARKGFHLSHAQVQMARELGMNPRKLGGMANHRQEPWKVPLPQYIEELYLKHFKKEQPDNVRSIEQMIADRERKQTERKERERQQRKAVDPENAVQPSALPPEEEAADDSIPFCSPPKPFDGLHRISEPQHGSSPNRRRRNVQPVRCPDR
jgi:hypothetical protein